LVNVITAFQGDAEAWKVQESALQETFNAADEAMYSNFGITGQEYALFYAENKESVDSYLDARHDDIVRVDALGEQINQLIMQFEEKKLTLVAPIPPN